MKLKHCNICNQDRPETDFHWRSKKAGIRISRCRFCWSEYTKKHYARNKNMYIRKAAKWNNKKWDAYTKYAIEYFKTHPCIDCGETDPIVLDFDHVKGKKKYNISSIGGGNRSWAVVLKEISKCVVRCANCHRRQTAKRGNFRKFRFASLM